MTGNLLNIWTEQNTYKTAKCKGCSQKLIQGETIVSMSRTQGSFTSVSNFHPACAKPVILKDTDEVVALMGKLCDVMQKVELQEKETENITAIFNEATQRFGSTLEHLGNG